MVEAVPFPLPLPILPDALGDHLGLVRTGRIVAMNGTVQLYCPVRHGGGLACSVRPSESPP